MNGSFKFSMGSQVTLNKSGELGEVIGRAEYATSEDAYFVRYRANDGRQCEQWWGESAIF